MNSTGRTILAEDGRKLQVLEAGKPDGVPVLVHHGTPGSALLYGPWMEDARSQGIRLMIYGRPGYGGSTPRPGRTVADAAQDVRAIAKALGLDRLVVWGHSGGGPHALACAALLPELVVAAAALSSPAPYEAEGLDWLAGMGSDNVAEFGAALEGRKAILEFVEKEAPGLMAANAASVVQAMRSLLSPPDVAVMTEDVAGYFIAAARQGLQASCAGWADDDIAFTTPWGFDLDQIRVPVLLMHGGQDLMAPFSHGRWLAGRIPNADVRLLPDDGHVTVGFRRIHEVHAWLLARLN